MPERLLCGRLPPSIPVADQNLQTDVTETTVPETVPTPQNGVPTDASVAGTMIVFDGVTKVYDPHVVALNDVSFVIDKGESVRRRRPGSGKSTMIRLLLKELEPSSGRILAAATSRG
jgi:ABC-type multidrug transport system fused ATPase/permease subunit